MKLSNTTIRELSAKYRSILRKCAYLNAFAIMGIAFSANATYTWTHPTMDSYTTVNEAVDYTVPVGSYNVITGTAMRDTIGSATDKKDVNLTLNNITQTGTSEFEGVYGNMFLNSARITQLNGTTPTTTQKLAQQYINGNLNMTLTDSTVARNVVGNQFYFSGNEISKSGISGTTTITLNNSKVAGDLRGANTGDTAPSNPSDYVDVNDIVLNINNSMVEDEVVSVGGKLSAGNVTINVKGNSSIGYDINTPSQKATGEDGWIIAGANQTGGRIANTEINLNTDGNNTIKIAGDVQVGSRERTSIPDTDVGSVTGNATLNMLGGGTINIGGDVRAYHVADTRTLNIQNSTVKVDGTVANEFDKISLTDALLTTTTFNTADNAVLNATLGTSKITATTVDFGLNNTLNLIVANGQEDDVVDFIGATNLTDAENVTISANDLYDLSLNDTTGKITVAKKSTAEVVSNLADQGVGAQQAAAISAFADNTADVPVLQAITTALQAGNTGAATKATDDLAPTTSQTVMGVAQGVNSILSNVAGGRMAAVGRAAGDAFVGGALWAQGLYNHTKQNSSASTSGFSADTKGISFGLDGKLTKALMIGVGYGYTDTDADAGSHDIDVEGHNFFVYSEYKPSNWYINGMFTYGLSKYDEQKSPMGVSVKAKYDVDTYAANLMTGYDFANGLTPEIGMRYLLADQESYNDGVQRVEGDKTDVLTGVAAIKYHQTYKTKNWTFKPNLRLGATYDMMTDDSKANVSVIGGGAYQITGEHLERFGVETGVGVEASVKDWNFSLNYEGGFRKDYQSHTGMLKAKYNF